MTLAVVGQARLLLAAKKSLEAIAASYLVQACVADLASSKSNHWWLSH
jgi:hypothetical protein